MASRLRALRHLRLHRRRFISKSGGSGPLLVTSQEEFGDRVGLTRQTIIAIEQGRYSPSLEAAFKIARVFGVPLEDVFHYEDEQKVGREKGNARF